MMRNDVRPEDEAPAVLTSFRKTLGRLNSSVYANIAAGEYARPETDRRRVGAYVHEITLADYGIKERPSYNAVYLSLFMAWYYTQPLVEFDSVMGCAVDGTAETSAVDTAMLIRLWGAPANGFIYGLRAADPGWTPCVRRVVRRDLGCRRTEFVHGVPRRASWGRGSFFSVCGLCAFTAKSARDNGRRIKY